MKKRIIKSGVYIITSAIDNKHYVGYSSNVHRRLLAHQCTLKNGYSDNCHLQSAYNLYGKENFTFEPLEYYPLDVCPSMENWWCNMLNTHNDKYGYNIKPTNPDNTMIMVASTRKKISDALTGIKRSAETRKKVSDWQIGKEGRTIKKVFSLNLLNGVYTEYRSLKVMSMDFKCTNSNLSAHIQNGSCYNNHVFFYDEMEEIEINYKNIISKQIVQVDLVTGEFIKIFKSAYEAQNKYHARVYNVANGKIQSCLGFGWKWYKNLTEEEKNNCKIELYERKNTA